MKVIDRVEQIIKAKGTSINAFEKSIDVSSGLIQTAIKKHTSLKDDTISKILDTYPDINLDWLFKGQGDMFFGKKPENSEKNSKSHDYSGIKEKALNIIRSKDSKIKPSTKEFDILSNLSPRSILCYVYANMELFGDQPLMDVIRKEAVTKENQEKTNEKLREIVREVIKEQTNS